MWKKNDISHQYKATLKKASKSKRCFKLAQSVLLLSVKCKSWYRKATAKPLNI